MNPLLNLTGSVASAANNGSTTLMAGAAETITTPAVEGPEVYDDLYARALVLSDNTRCLAIVTADIGGLNIPDVEILLEVINRATGIPPENIVVNSNHTHNALWPGYDHLSDTDYPWQPEKQASTVDDASISYDEWLPESSEELDPYIRWLFGHIAEAVKRASDNLQPTTLRIGRAPSMIAYNRWLTKDDGEVVMAPNAKGSMVPWVDVLSAYDENGKAIGIVFSYAAHPVIVHYPKWPSFEQTYIGPDFPGYAIKHLRNLLSKDGDSEGVFMFAQGCCGDINGHPLRGGIGACETAGLSLAFAITRALADSRTILPAPLRVRTLKLYEPDGPAELQPFPMSAFAVGDEFCLFTLPREPYSAYQLFVEDVSPFPNTQVFGYTNGTGRYILPDTEYEQPIKDGITSLLREVKSGE